MPFIKRKGSALGGADFTKTYFKKAEDINQAFINGLALGDLVVARTTSGDNNYVVVEGQTSNDPPRLLLVGGEKTHSFNNEEIVTDSGLTLTNSGTDFTFTTSKLPLNGSLVFDVVRVLCSDGNSIDVLGSTVVGNAVQLPVSDYSDLVAAGAVSATVTYLVRDDVSPQSYFL